MQWSMLWLPWLSEKLCMNEIRKHENVYCSDHWKMCEFENEAMWVTNQSNAKNAGVTEFEWLETESVAMWNVIFEKREKK